MDAVEKKILHNYLGLMEKLNPSMKANIIEQLSQTLTETKTPASKMKAAFGAWESDEQAEEIISNIYQHRNIKRQIEEF